METMTIEFNIFWNPFERRQGNNASARRSGSVKRLGAMVAFGLCVAICGCSTAKISGGHAIGAVTVSKPKLVYVSDFELEAANVKSERGLLPLPPTPGGPLGDMLPRMPGSPKEPHKLAREVVDTMSASLVKELNRAGLNAHRMAPGESVPKDGWLVRGVFTEVNQGNQMQRAMIGFGSGKTDLQAVVDISDLSQGAPKKFYEMNADADSGKAPGSAPMIALCPAGAAARFVIAGQDLNRNVKQTASKIAAEVIQRTKQTQLASTTK
jgi:hypothetical protein